MTRRELLAWLAILAFAIALRVYQIDALPPGLWFDEAANGVDALHILQGEHPIFFVGNQGREPFFIYLMAAMFQFIGSTPVAIRLCGVLIGIAAVAVTFFLGRAMFGSRVGLFAMSAAAVSYWHLSLSRIGFRALSLTLFEAIALFFLWRALKTRRPVWFAASGVAVGASLYTYLASRIFPLWLGVFLLLLAVLPRWRPGITLRSFLANAALLVFAAVVTFAPLGNYFLHHTDQFLGRAEVAAGLHGDAEQNQQAIAESVVRTLGMFFVAGDQNPRHNLPGRPVFDPLQGAVFLVGLIVLLSRWRERESVLLFLWLCAALLPGMLSGEAPHFLRTSGLLPGLYIVVAVGLEKSGSWITAQFRRVHLPNLRHAGSLAAVLLLLSTAGITVHDYFGTWAHSAAAYYGFEADVLDSAKLLAQVPQDAPVFASTGRSYRGMLVPLAFTGQSRTDLRSFTGNDGLVVPSLDSGSIYYVIPRSASVGDKLFKGDGQLSLPGVEHLASAPGPEGTIAASLYRVQTDLLRSLGPQYELHATAAGSIDVLGYDLIRRGTPGSIIDLAVFQRVLRPFDQPGTWQMYAHLLSQDRRRPLAQGYNEIVFSNQLKKDDLIISWYRLIVPADLSPGVYPLILGIFDRATGRQLSMLDPGGKEVGTSVMLLPVRIVGPAEATTPQYPLQARFSDHISLVGYDVQRDSAGKNLRLTLHWAADGAPSYDYTVFTHLLSADGKILAQQDNQPQSGQLPTTLFDRGDVVTDEYRFPLPAGSGAGLQVALGLYRAENNARLPLLGANGQATADHVLIPVDGAP